MGIVLGPRDEVENKAEMPCPLEALKGCGRDVTGCCEIYSKGIRFSLSFTEHLLWISFQLVLYP